MFKDLPSAVLIDLDGVLLDTESLNGEAWQKTASFYGANLSIHQLKTLLGRSKVDCAKDILKIINKRTITLEDLYKVHLPYQRVLLKTSKPVKNAEKLIRWLNQAQIPTALVTSSSSSSVAYKMSLHPWINIITTKIYGNDPSIKKGKPSPEPFLLAATRLKVQPESCWAIEDSSSGVKSALKAGCKVWEFKKDIDLNKNIKKNIDQNLITCSELEIIINSLKRIIESNT